MERPLFSARHDAHHNSFEIPAPAATARWSTPATREGKLIVDEAQELSLLIGDIYDASLDRALWPDAVNRIRTYLRACMASLVSQDAVTKAVDVHFMLGPEQTFLDQYNETYFKINPIFPTVMFLEIEQRNTLSDVLPLKDFVQTRFAKEWIQPQGVVDGLFSTLEKSPSGCTVLMTMRHKDEGFFDDEGGRGAG